MLLPVLLLALQAAISFALAALASKRCSGGSGTDLIATTQNRVNVLLLFWDVTDGQTHITLGRVACPKKDRNA